MDNKLKNLLIPIFPYSPAAMIPVTRERALPVGHVNKYWVWSKGFEKLTDSLPSKFTNSLVCEG